MFTRDFWDERYSTSERIWSGRPNPRLVEHVSALAPGTAIDVGCGEGADAVWLAARGWGVVGVDVSGVALDRARQHALEAGVGDRTTWVQADLVAGEALPGTADTGLRNERLAHLLFAPEQVTALLDAHEWETEVADALTREVESDDGPVTVTDSVVFAKRLDPSSEEAP